MDPRLWARHVAGRCLPSNVGEIYFTNSSPGNAIDENLKPYKTQGAAMAIEDAAVLGNLLSRISHVSQLGPLLKAYQDLRLERTALVQANSRASQRVYHLPDGEEQRARDEKIKRSAKANDDEIFGYDAYAEVDKWWASHGKDFEASARSKPPSFTGDDAAFACVVSACVFFFLFLKR